MYVDYVVLLIAFETTMSRSKTILKKIVGVKVKQKTGWESKALTTVIINSFSINQVSGMFT